MYGLICLQLAAKMDGKYAGEGYGSIVGEGCLKNTVLHPLSIIKETGFVCSLKDLSSIELHILSTMGYKLVMSTPLEIAKSVLYVANPLYDYSAILEKLSAIITFSLIDTQIGLNSDFSMFSIGIGSVLPVL